MRCGKAKPMIICHSPLDQQYAPNRPFQRRKSGDSKMKRAKKSPATEAAGLFVQRSGQIMQFSTG